MMRHHYKKHPSRDGMCECGEGRGQAVHNMLTWSKARTGNWMSSYAGRSGQWYRCRYQGKKWIPELANNPDWLTIGPPSTLAEAKAACEKHRSDNEQRR